MHISLFDESTLHALLMTGPLPCEFLGGLFGAFLQLLDRLLGRAAALVRLDGLFAVGR